MENKNYFFAPDKNFFKQGFFLTDENKNIVYEAKVLKQSLFSAATVSFVNHISNISSDHKIGKTITQEENNNYDLLSTKSYFKYDGKNIWDYLHELGIRIDSSRADGKLGMTYSVTLKGKDIGTITMSSPNGKSFIVTRNNFNIETSEENLDLVFLIAFSIAKTEQVFYD